jgi:hypothetical protein
MKWRGFQTTGEQMVKLLFQWRSHEKRLLVLFGVFIFCSVLLVWATSSVKIKNPIKPHENKKNNAVVFLNLKMLKPGILKQRLEENCDQLLKPFDLKKIGKLEIARKKIAEDFDLSDSLLQENKKELKWMPLDQLRILHLPTIKIQVNGDQQITKENNKPILKYELTGDLKQREIVILPNTLTGLFGKNNLFQMEVLASGYVRSVSVIGGDPADQATQELLLEMKKIQFRPAAVSSVGYVQFYLDTTDNS